METEVRGVIGNTSKDSLSLSLYIYIYKGDREQYLEDKFEAQCGHVSKKIQERHVLYTFLFGEFSVRKEGKAIFV